MHVGVTNRCRDISMYHYSEQQQQKILNQPGGSILKGLHWKLLVQRMNFARNISRANIYLNSQRKSSVDQSGFYWPSLPANDSSWSEQGFVKMLW